MEKEQLTAKKITVLGIQGSGKTYLAKYISQSYKSFVYSPHYKEWDDTKVYAYAIDSVKQFITDFPSMCAKIKELALSGKINMFIIDEADLLFKSNYDINDALNDLVLSHRHYGLALMFITRRPQDIPTKIMETCHFIFAFALEGDNAIKKLNNIRSGFGESVKTLKDNEFKFYIKEIGKEPILSDKI